MISNLSNANYNQSINQLFNRSVSLSIPFGLIRPTSVLSSKDFQHSVLFALFVVSFRHLNTNDFMVYISTGECNIMHSPVDMNGYV